jgi:hypothetical protein
MIATDDTQDFYTLTNDADTLSVTFTHEGEGKWGDYYEDDPDDTALLRFSVYYRDQDGEWQDVHDASYCTGVSVDAKPEYVLERLHIIMANIDGKVDADGYGIKKICEELSWLS